MNLRRCVRSLWKSAGRFAYRGLLVVSRLRQRGCRQFCERAKPACLTASQSLSAHFAAGAPTVDGPRERAIRSGRKKAWGDGNCRPRLQGTGLERVIDTELDDAVSVKAICEPKRRTGWPRTGVLDIRGVGRHPVVELKLSFPAG